MTANQRSCNISIIGPTNAGKSTLMNCIVGARVSIVTPKVQTTRNNIRAIINVGNSQLVFTDTPGIFKTKRIIDKFMVKQAWSSIEDSDVVMVIVDVKKGLDSNLRSVVRKLFDFKSHNNIILVLNKIDLINTFILLPMIEEINKEYSFQKIFMISALKEDGVNNLVDYLASQSKDIEWCYEPDEITDVSYGFMAKEITRKHLLLFLEEELPYELNVEQERWDENEHSITIYQVIYVALERHKKIVIGKNGQLLKKIGTKSRKEISYLLSKKVNLYLFVKIFPKWEEDFVEREKILNRV